MKIIFVFLCTVVASLAANNRLIFVNASNEYRPMYVSISYDGQNVFDAYVEYGEIVNIDLTTTVASSLEAYIEDGTDDAYSGILTYLDVGFNARVIAVQPGDFTVSAFPSSTVVSYFIAPRSVTDTTLSKYMVYFLYGFGFISIIETFALAIRMLKSTTGTTGEV